MVEAVADGGLPGAWRRERPALLILDIMMPHSQRLRCLPRDTRHRCPCADYHAQRKSEEIDKVLGLQLGADDDVSQALRHP